MVPGVICIPLMNPVPLRFCNRAGEEGEKGGWSLESVKKLDGMGWDKISIVLIELSPNIPEEFDMFST